MLPEHIPVNITRYFVKQSQLYCGGSQNCNIYIYYYPGLDINSGLTHRPGLVKAEHSQVLGLRSIERGNFIEQAEPASSNRLSAFNFLSLTDPSIDIESYIDYFFLLLCICSIQRNFIKSLRRDVSFTIPVLNQDS